MSLRSEEVMKQFTTLVSTYDLGSLWVRVTQDQEPQFLVHMGGRKEQFLLEPTLEVAIEPIKGWLSIGSFEALGLLEILQKHFKPKEKQKV